MRASDTRAFFSDASRNVRPPLEDRILNHIYRLVWNRKLRVWQAASELATQSRGGRSSAQGNVAARMPRYAAGLALAFGLSGVSAAVQAACSVVDVTVTCTGAADPGAPGFASNANLLDVTVELGATVGVDPTTGGTAMSLTGSNITLSNAGRIDANLLGASTGASSGLVVGNASASTIHISNLASGTLGGVVDSISPLPSLAGLALAVQNGTGGVSHLTNAGIIQSSPRAGMSTSNADMPVIAAYGGGRVDFVNQGTITGRIGFQATGTPGVGHSFVNAGTILGGVSLGQGGNNTYTAVSGSYLARGTGLAIADWFVADIPGLSFAPPGTVDGGTGAGDTLVLQNVLPSAGVGVGTGGGVMSISGNTYINFDVLRVNSGSWNLDGVLLNSSGVAELNGGQANLADGSVLGTAEIRANGGAIALAMGGQTLANNIVLGAQGLRTTGANDFTLSGNLSGSGGLTKEGAGTLTLIGTNSYTGVTLINAGTLQVGDGAVSGSIAGNVNIASGATLAFNRSDRVVFGGAVSGAGQLRHAGAGTLVLTGQNTFTGNTLIDTGTLQVGDGGTTGSITGNIANQGSLVFNRSDDLVYAGAISGAGGTSKLGAGALVLTGDSSAYTGITQLSAGTLQVDGKLGGSVLAATGTTLAGAGGLNSVTVGSGATLSPGNATTQQGRMTLSGDLTFQPGSTYRVTSTANGQNSSVQVAGTANLGGSVVQVGENGNYAASTTYTILSANNGVQGRFDTVSSNLAFLTPSLSYDSNRVDLVVNLKDVPADGGGSRPIEFADAAVTGNQRSVAGALQSLPTNSALYRHILNLPNGAPPEAFDALSGEAHASTASVLQNVSGSFTQMPMTRLHANLNAGQVPGAPTAQLGMGDAASLPQSAAQPLWTQVFGKWTTLAGDSNSAKTTQSDAGVTIGGDVAVGGGWRLGGAVGYANSDSRTRERASSAETDSYSIAVYGGKAFDAGPGKINLSLGAAYSWHDVDTQRSTAAAGLDQTLKASYGASTSQFFTELGYAAPVNEHLTLEPFIAANYSDLRTRGFTESGGDAALRGQSSRNDITTTTLGLHALTTFDSAGARGYARGTLGWRHAFGDLNPASVLAFAQGGDSFTATGTPVARDAVVVELGVGIAVSKRTTVGVSYGGQFGDGNRQNIGTLDVRYRF